MTVSAKTGGKLIALTFDDGPSGYTSGLLDGLAQRNVKVTFFIVGQSANAYAKTIRRAYNEGHQIAQHTYDHPALSSKTNEQIRWQIETTDSILDNIIGKDLNYLVRTPYGDCNERVMSQLGTANILWSVDSLDWQLLNAQKVCDKIVNNAHDGAIVLVHDIHKTSIPGALSAIDILLEQGYEFVTVNELFRRRGVALEAGKKYYSCKPNGIDYGALSDPIPAIENGKLVFMNVDENAKVYYTTDGSAPTQNSTVYSEPIDLFDGQIRYFAASGGAQTRTLQLTVTKQGNLFEDVFTWDWFFNAVDTAVALGIFQGIGGYKFAPQTGLTRAMFVTILYRLMQMQGENTDIHTAAQFSDLNENWYMSAVVWASENNIVNGYEDGTFRPGNEMTREEMCSVLDRTLVWLDMSTDATEVNYEDVELIASWALDSVARVSEAGLILGIDGKFEPKGTTTRAQAATVMLRLRDYMKAN